LYWNGARLDGIYPASIVFDGFAMNITLVSYARSLDFGIVACRRSLPEVQRMIDYLEEALVELEEVAGLRSAGGKNSVAKKGAAKLRAKKPAAAMKPTAKKQVAKKSGASKPDAKKIAAKKAGAKKAATRNLAGKRPVTTKKATVKPKLKRK
jgi:diacylglycerol O-acyltransferase